MSTPHDPLGGRFPDFLQLLRNRPRQAAFPAQQIN